MLQEWFDITEYPPTKAYEIIKDEVELLGYSNRVMPTANEDIYIVTGNTGYGDRILILYQLREGKTMTIKCRPGKQKLPTKGDIIKIYEIKHDFKKRLIDGKWTNLDEKEYVLTKFSFIE